MSQDTMELIKVLMVTVVIFAASTLVMLYGIALLAQYGGNLPMVGSLPLAAPPELIPLLADSRLFSTLAAVHVVASGFVLVLTSHTLDTALLIVAKAAAVVITALIGFSGGHMIYLQLTESAPLRVSAITPAVIALAGFLLLSSLLSVPALRRLGALRLPVALGLILIGPLLILWR
ncbi:MAG: hypothetical protein KIT02_02445 [Devosia sp.]|uniref:hypothetical protein n=1 Tax=Devosia sp. TaxID=1871048 RepID=UPI0024C9CB3E|nr:hypothetical protein [Devosia sp.]UYO00113.1 MAG: hypothetical protein KIT02_02445 [Devosia sp.]